MNDEFILTKEELEAQAEQDWLFEEFKIANEIAEKVGVIQKKYKMECEIAFDSFVDGDVTKEQYEERIQELNKILDSEIDAIEKEYHVDLSDSRSW